MPHQSDCINEVIKAISLKENINDPKLIIEPDGNVEGYGSVIKYVKLEGTNKTLSLVIKIAPRQKSKTPQEPFVQEINFYEKVCTTFEQFEEDFNIKERFDNIPKCYHTVSRPGEEILVFENLKSSGYKLCDRTKLMNSAHIEAVIKCYAKFHGTSIALKTLKPQVFENLKNLLDADRERDIFEISLGSLGFYEKLPQFLLSFIDVFDKTSENHYYETFKLFAKDCDQHLRQVMNRHEEEVISQGDCWCYNIIFKYSDENNGINPVHVKLLDFQTALARPPVLDFAYYFYVSAPEEDLNNLDYYLKLYHDTLGDHIKQFNLNIEDLLPYTTWIDLWAKFAKFGLMWGLLLRRESLGEIDAPDLTIPEEDDFVFDPFAFKNVDEIEYRKQVKYLVRHFIDRKFI